jgi:hypothetical protein
MTHKPIGASVQPGMLRALLIAKTAISCGWKYGKLAWKDLRYPVGPF